MNEEYYRSLGTPALLRAASTVVDESGMCNTTWHALADALAHRADQLEEKAPQ